MRTRPRLLAKFVVGMWPLELDEELDEHESILAWRVGTRAVSYDSVNRCGALRLGTAGNSLTASCGYLLTDAPRNKNFLPLDS